MRNPQRLDMYGYDIKELHKNNLPDWRIGQMITNFLSWHITTYKTDIFYIEDDMFVERFEKFIKEMMGE